MNSDFTAYLLLKTLHILLVGLWIGTDIATMAGFRGLCDETLDIKTRLRMSKLSDAMDMGPRSSLVLLLMLGLFMTNLGEWGLEGKRGEWLAWGAAAVGVVWFLGVWQQYFIGHKPETERTAGARRFHKWFRHIDLWWRIGLSGVLVVAAVWSLAGDGPFNARWLAAKQILFAGIVMCGVGLRLMLPPIMRCVMVIVQEGSTPEREAALERWAWPAQALVFLIWVIIAVMSWLATAKPF
jgi:uncharacterized membrane protein